MGPQVIFAVDRGGLCTLSTGPGLRNLGVEPGQLVGLNLFDVYRDDPRAVRSLRRALAGESFTTESLFSGRILSVFYQPVHGPDGEITGALGVSTDVTEQRRAEAEVRAARERASMLADLTAELTREVLDPAAILRLAVRSITEAVADAGLIWLYDAETGMLEPRSTWGPDPDATAGWDMHKARLPLDSHLTARGARGAPRIIDLTKTGVAQGSRGELPARLVRKLRLHTNLRLPLRSRGVLVGAVDVARGGDAPPFSDEDVALAMDIAERCALALDNARLLDEQRAAREELVKFKALADASSNLIAINAEDGRALYVNPRVYEMGVDAATEDIWVTVEDRLGPAKRDVIQAALRALGRWSGDVTLSAPTGEAVVSVDVFALRHPETAALLGYAWIGEDVTELRRTEAALQDAVADLKKFEALVEASPDFIAIADLDGAVQYVNPRGRELVGIPQEVDVASTVIADFLTPEGLVASREVQQPAVLAKGHWEGESTLRSWNGGPPVPVAIASFMMRDAESGEPFALATVQRDITERLRAERALRELADQRQALLTRLVDAQDAERARIAADVHDDPVQALAAVDLRLGLLRRRLREGAPDLITALDPLQESVSGATDRLRALLFDLEPPDLQHGLGPALRRAADDVFESTHTRWKVCSEGEPEAPDAVRAVAYRVVREALINVRKHASAMNVEVIVSGREGGIEVEVVDDGVGIGSGLDAVTPGHRGLATMQDRAAAAGGRCAFSERTPSGTCVTLWLPAARK